MKKSALTTQTKDPNSAVLIVDKIGAVGEKLAEEFSKDFFVVLLSGRVPEKLNSRASFIFFKNKIPKVPKNKYAKIFLIDDGKEITKDTAFSFIKEAKAIDADFYFLGSVRNFDIKHTDELVKIYNKAKVLVFGDLFDKKFLFDHDSSITKFILEAGNKKKIKVPGEGLSLSYPINFEDTIKLILKAVYLKIPEQIILLFYKSAITDLSLAHLFQKIDPDIKVDFEKQIKSQDFFIPNGAEFAISKYDLKKRIEELDLSEPKKILIKNKKVKYNNKFFKIFGTLLLLIFFLFTLPFLVTQIYLSLGEKQLENSINLSQDYDYEKALKKASNANSFLSFSESADLIYLKQLNLISKGYLNIDTRNQIQNSLSLSNTLINIYESAVLYEQIYNKKSLKTDDDFNKVLLMLNKSFIDFEKLNIDRTFNDLKNINSSIEFLSKISNVLDEILGFEKEKTYLVLFQDSNEIRPGGGKIDSVAKIKIDDGAISGFEILSVNDLDKNLKVHVEPPFPVRRYLKSKDYYLKDSNFDADFLKGASATSAIYKLETGNDVDGIIGVDLFFLEYLLEKTGPVYIKEIDKNISAENINQIASEYKETNDETFIELLLINMNLKLNKKNKISPFTILEIIEKAAKEKHLLFAFKDQEIQNIFTKNNLSGSLEENRILSEKIINDTFGIFEANLGISKINYFISRSVIKNNIIESNGEVNSEVVIVFKNSSQKGSIFAKTYKNYVQIILPNGVNLSQVSVDGKKQNLTPAISDYKVYENPDFINPEELEIDQVSEEGINRIGLLISVEPDSIQTMKLNYTLPFKVSTQTNSSTKYSLLIFKQPGIRSYPFNLIFEESNDFQVLPQNVFSYEIKKDEIIESTIIKK